MVCPTMRYYDFYLLRQLSGLYGMLNENKEREHFWEVCCHADGGFEVINMRNPLALGIW
jgi:hypothetical protein